MITVSAFTAAFLAGAFFSVVAAFFAGAFLAGAFLASALTSFTSALGFSESLNNELNTNIRAVAYEDHISLVQYVYQ